ncbi:MAG TPA: phage tail tape measure protein [Clostridia bacterium]|nr:phage tail tape measure protein [Clostridia bacterium]
MAETTREMVVRLSMDAGGFKKTASEINRQIRNIDSEIKGMGGDPGRSQLEEKLGLQQKAVENLQKAVEAARAKFNAADTDAQKLLAAKQLSGLETQLTTAEAKAQALKNQLSAANLIKFGTLASNFGKSMQLMGRTMSLYVSGPLAALGGKAYKTALDFESATVSMQKTIDETDTTKYADIEAAFKSLSETAPVGYTELMELAGQAGALGVSADEVIEFVKSVAMISETADDLDASSGADVLARFLNVTDQGSFENITRTASAVTALGNNLATTEGELLAMAQRMASTGELAGMSNEAILALAASLTSVDINAEAGGSAAGKLMKQMQLAGETGRRAMQEFSEYSETAGLSARDLQLAADSSEWVEATAIDLGRTKNEVKDMVASMVALEQFSGVMNVTPAQFIAGWNENAGQSILDFFIGLNEIETSTGEESVLSKLQEMGLTEIRLSNMIAAAAANPDIFVRAMEISNEAYEQNTALAEEAEKRYATAESYQRIQLNRMENAAADAGENLVDPIQNIMTKITDLVGKFGELDEGTQNWILGIGSGLAVGGPALVGLGKVIETVGKISTAIGKAKTSTGVLQGMMSSPALWGVVAGVGAVSLLVAAIESIESPTEKIINNLKNIVIGLDEESYNTTMAALAEVKAQADALSGEKGEYNKNISAAVKRGYGTDDMYGTALGYEAMLTQSQIAEIAGRYSDKYEELNAAIGAAKTDADAKRAAEERDALKANWDAEVAQAKANYMAQVSALVSGMMQGQPEVKAALEQAAKDYDLLAALENVTRQVMATDDMAAVEALLAGFFTPDIMNNYFEGQSFENIAPATAVEVLRQELISSLKTSLEKAGGDESLAYTLLQSILTDPLAGGLYDATLTQGALDGLVELLDFKNAAEQSGTNFGDALTPGLSDAITESIPDVSGAMNSMQTQLVSQAAAMGAAVAAAFNNNLNFRLPNATGGGVNVNVNSPTAADIYKIRKGLTDASRRAARGYGAG